MDYLSSYELFDSQEAGWFNSPSALVNLNNMSANDSHHVEGAQGSKQDNLHLPEYQPQISPSPGNLLTYRSQHSTSVSPLPSRPWTPTITLTDEINTRGQSVEVYRRAFALASPSYDLVTSRDGQQNPPTQHMFSPRGKEVPRTLVNGLSRYQTLDDLLAAPGQTLEENQYISGSVFSNHHDFSQSGDGYGIPIEMGYYPEGSSSKANVGGQSPSFSYGLQFGDDDEGPKMPEASSLLGSQTAEEENPSDQPYAKLIYRAMMEAPGHRMTLRQIYGWFRENTTKARDAGSRGWQNSIRHNLSMNQAFESEKASLSHGQSKKSNNDWVLTEKAILHGVQSTTRYRKAGINKKPSKIRTHQQCRQQAGAKGGRATRRAAMLKSQQPQAVQPMPDNLFAGGEFKLQSNVDDAIPSPLIRYEPLQRHSSPQQLEERAFYGTVEDEEFPLFNESLPLLSLDDLPSTRPTTPFGDAEGSSMVPAHNDFDDFLS